MVFPLRLFVILIFPLALFLSVGALSFPAPAQDFSSPATLTELDIQNHPEWTKLLIKTDQYIEYITYEVSEPPGIIFDPVEPLLCELKETLLVQEGLVTSAKIIKHTKDVTEREGFYLLDFLVIELKTPALYSTIQRVNLVTIEIGKPPEVPAVTPSVVEKKPPAIDVRVIVAEKVKDFVEEVKMLGAKLKPPMVEVKLPVEEEKPIEKGAEIPILEGKPLESVLEGEPLEPAAPPEAKVPEALPILEIELPEFIETKPISPPEVDLIKVAGQELEERRPPRLRVEWVEEPKLAKELEVEQVKIEVPFEVKEAEAKEVPEPLPLEESAEAKVERPAGRTFRGLRDEILSRAEVEARIQEIPEKGPLSFEECLAMAAYNYMPLQIADEEIRLAEMKVREAKRALYPTASAKGSFTEGDVYDVGFRERTYGVEIEQPLYYSGRLRLTLRQAQVNREVAFEKYDKAQAELMAKVTEKFYELAAAQTNLEDQRKLSREASITSSLAKKRFDIELSTNLELLNVKSQSSKIEYQIAVAYKELEMAKVELLQTMGLDPSQDIQVDFGVDYKELDIGLNECLRLAFENRPELVMHELLLESSELEGAIAKSKEKLKAELSGFVGRSGGNYETEELDMGDDWYIGLKVTKPWGSNTGNYSYTQNETAPKLGQDTRTASATHSLEFAIMNNLAVFSEKQTAFIGLLKAENELLEMEKTVNLEVREAYNSYEKSIMQIQNTLERIKFRQEGVKILEAEASLNEALLSQVLEAKVGLADEISLHNQAIASYKTALANLNKAIGIAGYFDFSIAPGQSPLLGERMKKASSSAEGRG